MSEEVLLEERKKRIREIVSQRLEPGAFVDEAISEGVEACMKQTNPFFIALGVLTQERYCDRCGNCCRLSDPVKIPIRDIPRMCSQLHITTGAFHVRYLDILDEDNYRFRQVPCPFLRPKFCIIYNARPTVCRGYPFVGILDTLLEDGHPQMQSFKCAALENHIADMVVFTLLKVDLTDPLKSKNPLFLKAHAMATRIVMAQQEKKKEYLRLKPRLLSNEGPTVAE